MARRAGKIGRYRWRWVDQLAAPTTPDASPFRAPGAGASRERPRGELQLVVRPRPHLPVIGGLFLLVAAALTAAMSPAVAAGIALLGVWSLAVARVGKIQFRLRGDGVECEAVGACLPVGWRRLRGQLIPTRVQQVLALYDVVVRSSRGARRLATQLPSREAHALAALIDERLGLVEPADDDVPLGLAEPADGDEA